jgi:hypothetical protein
MSNMPFMDFDTIARALTGRSVRDNTRILEYYQQRSIEGIGEIERRRRELERLEQETAMYYQSYLTFGGQPLKEFNDSQVFIDVEYQKLPEPVRKEPVPEPVLEQPKVEPPGIQVDLSPKTVKQPKTKKTVITPEEFARYYHKVKDSTGAYPPDIVSAEYFDIDRHEVSFVRRKATVLNLIHYRPVRGKNPDWDEKGSLEKIVQALGTYERKP